MILLLAVVIILSILILWAILHTSEKFRGEVVTSITTLMDNAPEVPSIELVEKTPTKNILQKILGNVNNQRIKFVIETVWDKENQASIEEPSFNYKVEVPSYSDYNFSGRGLVIAASGNRYRYLTGLYTNLWVIRKFHRSNIPIEVFYVGEVEKFTTSIWKLIMDLGNIRIINLLDRIDTKCTEEDLRGYQTKPLAVLCSSFKEIILMDADALCFIDPNYLFGAEGYADKGLVLFKDYVDCLSFISRDFIETIGIGSDRYCSYTGNFEIDSSCVIMDKERCWEALYTTCIINVKSDRYHKSKNVLGDKDVWLIAAIFVGMVPWVSQPEPQVLVDPDGTLVLGHLQSTQFIGTNDEVFTHYNNQMIDIMTIDLTDWTYAEVKNPKKKQIYGQGGEPLTQKMIDTFKSAREAMKVLSPHIPQTLLEKVHTVGGVSKGFIP